MPHLCLDMAPSGLFQCTLEAGHTGYHSTPDGIVWPLTVVVFSGVPDSPSAKTLAALEDIAKAAKRYAEQLQPQLDALRASSRITAADLAITINSPEPRATPEAGGKGEGT
jgi:hypothetical protein